MSESATTDHQDPQKSVLLKIYALPQQTQAFTQQSTPAVYAFAVPAPTARPKITATAKAAFITTLLCALLRIVEFTIMMATINSLHSAGEMSDQRYSNNWSFLLVILAGHFCSTVPQCCSVYCVWFLYFPGLRLGACCCERHGLSGFWQHILLWIFHGAVDKRIEGRTVSKDAWNFRYSIHAPDNLHNAVYCEHRSVCAPVAAWNQYLYVQL